MSFNKYVEKRNQSQKIDINIDSYRESILTQLSGQILKANVENKEIIKNTLNVEQIEKTLQKYKFPKTENCKIALLAGNTTNILKILDSYHLNDELKQIQSEITQYQRRLILEKLDSSDIDLCCENLCKKAQIKLQKLANYLNEVIKRLKHWDDIAIKIEAIYENQKLDLEKAIINFGDLISGTVEISLLENNQFKIEKVKLENLSDKTKRSILNLLENSENSKQSKILYFHSAIHECKHYNSIIKDLSLGIKTDFPLYINLYSTPIVKENFITWKIKVEAKNLLLYLNENNYIQYNFSEQPKIFWMEIYEEQH
jgi:hypothetical protein